MKSKEEIYVVNMMRFFRQRIEGDLFSGSISIKNIEANLKAIDFTFLVLNALEEKIGFFDYVFNRKYVKFINECKIRLIHIQCEELLKLKRLNEPENKPYYS
jgi:hypothetical protein